MIWRELSGVLGRVSQSDAKSSEKLKRLSAARDKENKKQLDGLQKSLAEALRENGGIKNELDRVKEDNEKFASDKEALQNELHAVKGDLAKVKGDLSKSNSDNEGMRNELHKVKEDNEKLKGYIQKVNSDNEALQRKIQTDSDNHAKEGFEFKRQLKDAEGMLASEKDKSMSLGKALTIHKDINSTRAAHNAEVENTEKIHRDAIRAKEAFEVDSAEGTEKVNAAVELLEEGQLAAGEKLISEVEETVEEMKKRKKCEKRLRKRENKRMRLADPNSSVLLDGEEADGDQVELST